MVEDNAALASVPYPRTMRERLGLVRSRLPLSCWEIVLESAQSYRCVKEAPFHL
jgi:hypothetical protein